MIHLFDYADDIDRAIVDFNDAHIWDTSAVAALDAVVAKFAAHHIDADPGRAQRAQRQPPHPHQRPHGVLALTAIDGMHQVGEVAEAVGLSPRTVLRWEEIGGVHPSGRSRV